MVKAPAFQFYPADWLNDIKLQSCSLAAQGLLLNLMCLMHQSEKYGYLLINGSVPSVKEVSHLLRLHHKTYQARLKELFLKGVLYEDENGIVCCKRMVKDDKKRDQMRASGHLGGNPKLTKFYNQPGYVYIIKRETDGLYKIGIAKNVKNRLNKIRYKNQCEIELVFLKSTQNMGETENYYHKRYEAKKVLGEWFNLSENDIITLKGEGKGKQRVSSSSSPSSLKHIEYPEWLDLPLWKEYKIYRTKIKAPLTDHAEQLSLTALKEQIDAGFKQADIVNATIESGKWKSFYPVRGKTGTSTESYYNFPECGSCGAKASSIKKGTKCNYCGEIA